MDFANSDYTIIDYWLGIFVLEARRRDGKPYPPNTLYNIIAGIQRYYRIEQKRPDLTFLDDKNHWFSTFREKLDSRMKELTEIGLNVINSSDPVTEEDEINLWKSGVLNMHTAKGLSYCVFFYNGKIFGLRGGSEHRDLSPEQYEFVEGASGEYMVFTARNSKNVDGGLKHRKVKPRVIEHYAQPDNEHCVVKIFQLYLSHIPKSGAFYKKPIDNNEGNILFSAQNMGENHLRTYMKTIFTEAGINTEGRKITNHSGRHCQVSTMYNLGMSDFDIRERSGHRSSALDKYKKPDENKKRSISHQINPPKPPAPATQSRPTTDEFAEDSDEHLELAPSAKTEQFHPKFLEPHLCKRSSTPGNITPPPHLRKRSSTPENIKPPPLLQRLRIPSPISASTPRYANACSCSRYEPSTSTAVSGATGGHDCMKLVVPESINKLVIYKGTRETIVILNN